MKYINMPYIKSEIWKRYIPLGERFCVSNHGRIFSTHTARLLKTSVDKYGYERIAVIVGSRKDGSRKVLNLKVHQMVAETFLGRPTIDKATVNHKDMNKLNNKVNNLEWCTASENYSHAKNRGAFKGFTMKGRRHTKETKNKISVARREWLRKLGV